MRNIFDQYSQPENRVTHALLTALNEDRRLLDGFLRELVGVKPPSAAGALSVLEQQYPSEEEPNEEDLDRRGIPDGWIFDADGWCVVIENKVIAPLSGEQLQRHRRTAERLGFTDITLVAITPREETLRPANIVLLKWRTIYGWLSRNARQSEWAARTAAYLEVAEAKLIDNKQLIKGELTMFSGIPFGDDHPFTYLEGKRILGLALGELRKRRDLQGQLGMNPSVPGRPAITGRRCVRKP